MQKASYSRLVQQLDFTPKIGHLLNHFVIDLLLVGVIALTNQGILYPLSQLLLPILMFRSFCLMHDCVHGSVIKNKAIGDGIGIIAGAFCLLPYEPWKKIHLLHHKWTGNVDKDPSMGLIKQFPFYKPIRVKVLNFCWQFQIPALAISQHFVFWTKSYQFVLEAKTTEEKVKNALSILIPLILYASISLTKNLPALALYLAMVEVINFPHHLQMPMLEGKDSYPVYDQYRSARSCQYPRWFSRNILNNFNLHIEHHLFPRLPWYQLDSASSLVKKELGEGYTGIKGNAWIRENRQKPIEEVFSKNIESSVERAA